MKKLTIILLLSFILIFTFSCKTTQSNPHLKDCFYKENNSVYINFYNFSNESKLIPNISSIVDKDFYILKDNLELINDTLVIYLADKRNVNLSDVNSPTITIVNDSIINNRKRFQQVFKSNLKFNVISINRDGNKSFVNQCDNNPN